MLLQRNLFKKTVCIFLVLIQKQLRKSLKTKTFIRISISFKNTYQVSL